LSSTFWGSGMTAYPRAKRGDTDDAEEPYDFRTKAVRHGMLALE
jgi:hypothetical protein